MRASKRWQAAGSVPTAFWVLILGILAAGAAAGVTASPVLLVTTPLLSAALAGGALFWSQRPLVDYRRLAGQAVPRGVASVAKTAASLPEGPIPDLLLDIAGAATRLIARPDRTVSPGRLADVLPALLEESCTTAREIENLDTTLRRLEEHSALADSKPREWVAATSRCGEARDLLVQKLLEVLASLGSSEVDLALRPDGPAESLDQRVQELRRESEAQLRVAKELSGLLAGRA